MASVVWDVGRDLKDAYVGLYEIVNNKDSYTKEQILEKIEHEALHLKQSYNNLAEDYGWGK